MNTPQVFISYSHSATEWVRRFAEELKSRSLRVWLDEQEISPGEPLRENIEKGLRGSDAIVAVITPDSLRSANLAFELGVALGMGKPLIPIVTKDVQPQDLPLNVRERRFIIQSDPAKAADEVKFALLGEAATVGASLEKGLTMHSSGRAKAGR